MLGSQCTMAGSGENVRQVVFEASPRIPGEQLGLQLWLPGVEDASTPMSVAPQMCDTSKQFLKYSPIPSAEI